MAGRIHSGLASLCLCWYFREVLLLREIYGTTYDEYSDNCQSGCLNYHLVGICTPEVCLSWFCISHVSGRMALIKNVYLKNCYWRNWLFYFPHCTNIRTAKKILQRKLSTPHSWSSTVVDESVHNPWNYRKSFSL